MLTNEDRTTLLRIAREAVAAETCGRSLALSAPPVMCDAAGVFVTLKRGRELRGCIGTLQCRGGLADEVARTARESASHDPRFPRVSPDELDELSLEISVLGPLEPIGPSAPDVIVIGKHGLVVEQGMRRGLLLPQVATEWGWTSDQFLRQTCRKAGLPDDAWQHGAQVYRFEADVFGE